MLVEEFLRAGVEFETGNKKLIDAQKIFHLMEKRTLSAAFQFYCNKSLEDAHSAMADTKATIDVLEAQILNTMARKLPTSWANPSESLKMIWHLFIS